MTIKPITPQEALDGRADVIPDFVIEAFNALIKLKMYNGTARITQNEAVQAVLQHWPGSAAHPQPRDHVFNQHWLDVEPLYRRAGWGVTYDKPGYNESYKPSFKFTVSK